MTRPNPTTIVGPETIKPLANELFEMLPLPERGETTATLSATVPTATPAATVTTLNGLGPELQQLIRAEIQGALEKEREKIFADGVKEGVKTASKTQQQQKTSSTAATKGSPSASSDAPAPDDGAGSEASAPTDESWTECDKPKDSES